MNIMNKFSIKFLRYVTLNATDKKILHILAAKLLTSFHMTNKLNSLDCTFLFLSEVY